MSLSFGVLLLYLNFSCTGDMTNECISGCVSNYSNRERDIKYFFSTCFTVGVIVAGVSHRALDGLSSPSLVGRTILAGPEADRISNSLWDFSEMTDVFNSSLGNPHKELMNCFSHLMTVLSHLMTYHFTES